AANRFSFSLKAGSPVQKKRPRGIGGALVYLYMYALIGLALLPQLYIVYLSFRNNNQVVFLPGYSLDNYRQAMTRLLGRSVYNTILFAVVALAIIIVLSVLLPYLVVRRSNAVNNFLDTVSMLPYIMPGAVIGIGLVIAFNSPPLALTGTMTVMIIMLVIRRMPYTIRSATATLMHLPMSMEEAARSLGASKLKAFWRITVPMMSAGVASGAVLSFVAIVTEMSAGLILYNNQRITLTMSAYVAISRVSYGLACAFSAILTVLTAVLLAVYLKFTKEEDVKMCRRLGPPGPPSPGPATPSHGYDHNPPRRRGVPTHETQQDPGRWRRAGRRSARPHCLQRRRWRQRREPSRPLLEHDRQRPERLHRHRHR